MQTLSIDCVEIIKTMTRRGDKKQIGKMGLCMKHTVKQLILKLNYSKLGDRVIKISAKISSCHCVVRSVRSDCSF